MNQHGGRGIAEFKRDGTVFKFGPKFPDELGDEFILVCDVYEPELRLRSLDIARQVWPP